MSKEAAIKERFPRSVHYSLVILLPLLAGVWLTPSFAQDNRRFIGTTAEVAAWNLEGPTPIPPERIPRFARVIADLDPEVIGLVEVNRDSVAAAVVAALNNDFGTCYRETILDQTATQNIGVLHKCEVAVSNPRLIPGSDDGNTHLRKALALDVKVGEFDFVLITVHMKAGRGSTKRQIRDRQAQAIKAFIQSSTSGAEKDVLVVGDYNMIPGEDQSNFDAMNPNNFLRFVSSEDLASEFSHISESGQPGDLLDGYAISRDHTSEYIAGSLRIFPIYRSLGMTLGEYRDQVSDHLPVLARFRITEDDD